MQGGTFGGFCFLAFLLSFGNGQNLEDLKTGLLQDDEFDANSEAFTINSEEPTDSDERAFGSLSGFTKTFYQNGPYGSYISVQPRPYRPFGYSQAYGLGSSYGEATGFSQAQTLDNSFGFSHAAAEANANAQALSDLTFHGSPYSSVNFGAGSSLAHAQADAQGDTISLGMGTYGPYAVSPGASLSFSSNDNTLGSGLGSNYASSDAIAQAVTSGIGGYENYGQDIISLAQAQATSQGQAFSSGFGAGFTSAEIDSQAIASGLGGLSSEISPFGSGYYASGIASAEANSVLSTTNIGSGLNSAGNADIQAQILAGNLNSFTSEEGSSGENVYKLSSAFAGANSRLIPPEEYIMPNIIPGGETIKICTREGEFHNVWSIGYDCLICACVSQYGYLSPICVTCDVCSAAIPFPPLPIPMPPPSMIPSPTPPPVPSPIPSLIPSPTPPSIPTPEPQVSCDPLPTNTPFQNPLNPCQICICQYSFGFKTDVTITCEENPSCVLSSDLITIPPVSEPPVPELLPLCEKFPPNVEFPHPVDICKSCECVVSYTDLGPQHKIVCYPKPECEPSSPIPSPFPSPIPSPIPSPTPPPTTELLPWPPLQKPLPPGPLPGPPPHKSCEPYPPNQPFQHPWDDCQICVCNEIYSVGIINIEVNCFTNPACCTSIYQSSAPQIIHEPYPVPVKEQVAVPYGVVVDRPVPVPQLVPVPKPVPVPQPVPQPYPVAVPKPVAVPQPVPQPYPVPVPHPVPVQQLVSVPQPVPVDRPVPVSLVIQPTKYLDITCKAREIGEEFMYSSCRICTCQAFGNLVVPICRRPNRPECVIMPAAVPLGKIVYIEPRCRYRPPWETFTSECQSCKCQSVFTYVIARCVPIPGCVPGQSYYGGGATFAEANTIASSQFPSSSFGQSSGFGSSQSDAGASSAYSGSAGYGGYLSGSGFSGSYLADESSANIQSGSNLYTLSPYSSSFSYGGQMQVNEIDGLKGFYTGSYPKPYGQIISVQQPGRLIGQSQNLAEAIAQSGYSTQGFSQAPGLFVGRPFIKSGDAEAEELEEKR